MKKLFLLLSFLLLTLSPILAQSDTPDFMRSIGKIFVVVFVIAIIFIGIFLFLLFLDKKVTKLESQIREDE
ncbi:MAG: CcmD family protein [Bacteroidetes bacterium]|nr:CcmD family protein [Bacteroidota bacterium]